MFDSDVEVLVPRMGRLRPSFTLLTSYDALGERQFSFSVDAAQAEATGPELLAAFESERSFLFHAVGLRVEETEAPRRFVAGTPRVGSWRPPTPFVKGGHPPRLFPAPREALEALCGVFSAMPCYPQNTACFERVFGLQFFAFEALKRVHSRLFVEPLLATWTQNPELVAQIARVDPGLADTARSLAAGLGAPADDPRLGPARVCLVLLELPLRLRGAEASGSQGTSQGTQGGPQGGSQLGGSQLPVTSGAGGFADASSFSKWLGARLGGSEGGDSDSFFTSNLSTRVSRFFSLANSDPSFADYLLSVGRQNRLGPRQFAEEKFLGIQMVKLMVNTHYPHIYRHLLASGCSVECLFLEDIWHDFSINLSPDTWLSFLGLLTYLREASPPRADSLKVLAAVFLIEVFLDLGSEALLAASDSTTLLAVKRTLFSRMSAAAGGARASAVQKVAEKMAQVLAESEGDPFESFEAFRGVFEEAKKQVSADYTSVFFDRFDLADVKTLFGLTRNVPDPRLMFGKAAQDWGDFEPPLKEATGEWTPGPVEVFDASGFVGVEVALRGLESRVLGPDSHVRDLELEVSSEGKAQRTKYDVGAGRFVANTLLLPKTGEDPLTFVLRSSAGDFRGSLEFDSPLFNVVQTRNIVLFCPGQGFIYLALVLVFKRPGPTNLDPHRFDDPSANFCLDRRSEAAAYRRASAVDVRSTVHVKFVELRLAALASELPIAKYTLDCVTKFLRPDTQTFPLAKLLIYLCVNAKRGPSEDALSEQLSLIFKILSCFERSDRLGLDTVTYFLESLWMNLLPLTPFHVVQGFSDFLFCGGAGKIESANLVDFSGRPVLDIVEIVRSAVVQNEIHSNFKFVHFGDPSMVEMIAGKAQDLGIALDDSMRVKVISCINSCRDVQVFELKPQPEKIHNVLNLESSTLVDEETFVRILSQEPLVRGLFFEPHSEDLSIGEGVVSKERVSYSADVLPSRSKGTLTVRPNRNGLDWCLVESNDFVS